MTWLLLAVLFIGGSVVYAIVGTLVARRFMRRHVAESHNDVLAPIFLTAGVIYAVLLGFMVIAAWQSYDTARSNTAEEASLLAPLYRQTLEMAPPQGGAMRGLIRDYATQVTKGWTAFRNSGEGDAQARMTIDSMLKVFHTVTPANKVGEITAAQFSQTLSQVLLDRDTRMIHASESMSWIMWVAAVGGGLITVGMSFVLYMEREVPHVVMTSVLAALIGILLFIMAVLDHPFVGPVGITAEPFAASRKLFDLIDSDFQRP